MTKPITSAAVLMLLEEGQLRLNDPVAHYIPAFKTVKVLDNSSDSGGRFVDPIRPINVRDLLTHTAGLSYGFEDNVYIDELYRKLWGQLDANRPLRSRIGLKPWPKSRWSIEPGTRYRYSMATDVLGYLVEGHFQGCPLRNSCNNASLTRSTCRIQASTCPSRKLLASPLTMAQTNRERITSERATYEPLH